VGGHSIGHSKQKSVYVHVSYSERFPRYSYFTVQYSVHCADEKHAMSSQELQSALMLTVEFSKMYYTSWPRGLRHKPSPPARTLGLWVRITLEAWMSVCVYSVCVVLCVGSGLAMGWSLVQGALPTVYRIKKLKKRPRFKGLYNHRQREIIC
jgi:hypothetical protein